MAAEKELYDTESEKVMNMKDAISRDPEDWIECGEENLRIGDTIVVDYSPDSQKHLYTHYPEYGTVESIGVEEYYSPTDDKTKTEISVTIFNHNGKLVKINKDHLSIYSRGYCVYIKKYRPSYRELSYPAKKYARTTHSESESTCHVCCKDHDEDY